MLRGSELQTPRKVAREKLLATMTAMWSHEHAKRLSAAYKNMFFTTLLIDVTPLEYNELNAGVRSHKTEDEWPQKCTVVINTGFTKQKIQNNGLLEELRKQKREGETPLFCEQLRHTQGSHKTRGLLFTNCRRCK